jgi:hypothetical protein
VPVVPDFQDPAVSANLPPYFESSTPLFQWQRMAPEEFSAKVIDPNPFDTLYVRWVSDYPNFQSAYSRLLQEGQVGSEAVVSYRVPISCETFSAAAPLPHRLVVIVADQPFKKPDQADNFDNKYNSTEKPTVVIMGGWTVTCQ